MCVRRTLTEEKEEKVMEEQTYKAQNGARRTEIKSGRVYEEWKRENGNLIKPTERQKERERAEQQKESRIKVSEKEASPSDVL